MLLPLPLSARPQPLPPSRAFSPDGASHRVLFCPHYAACLDLAVRAGWHDWSCRSCPLAPSSARPSATSLCFNQPGE